MTPGAEIRCKSVAGVLSAVALVTVLVVTGCTSGGDTPRTPVSTSPTAPGTSSPAPSNPASSSPAPTGPCDEGWTCAPLDVPLDRTDPERQTLQLAMNVETSEAAPRGLLLVLAGGPGQPAVGLVPRIVESLGPQVVDAYRVVLLDQRGTGASALDCPQLQQEMGYSDLTPPTVGAVRACGRTLGADREFYSTDDVVADLETLRISLGAPDLTLWGTSYGTFVAEHYAIAHPDHTRALVLDSVVPHAGIDALDLEAIERAPVALREACRTVHCPGDPARGLAVVVRRDGNGPAMLDLLTVMSIVDPTFGPLLPALHDAARGDEGPLDGLMASYHQGMEAPADLLSQGLHASALCSDSHFPWGSSAAPMSGRESAVRRAVARHSAADLWPFDAVTATGNGFIRQCLPWPRTPDAPLPRDGDLPDVPTLLLAGTRDLSTPLPWATDELQHAPGGRLVVVAGAGHGTVRQGGKGRAAMQAFLLR